MAESLLRVQELKTVFHTSEGIVRAVDGVNFEVQTGETLGIVGESGCGKSVTALSILRLIPNPPGRIVGGEVVFRGTNLMALSEAQMRKIRGNTISMIFQEPMTSLNPVFQVGNQIAEAIRIHQGVTKQVADRQAVEMLNAVGIPSPQVRSREYPHQMSGGMRQRVMIAMAFSCNPRVLIADEPTTALDVTIQAQILNLMSEMKDRTGSSIILITHDLGVIAENAQRVIVMYAGEIVESADVKTLFSNPLHPYTIGLLGSVPKKRSSLAKKPFSTIKGRVPSLIGLPSGCKFHNRCSDVDPDRCRKQKPELKRSADGHWVRCWKHG
ncbi:MAG: ABC transporter ATP-binding protein [Spirochaetaceae bacterium]|nr:MAG: ABC transporter ATP-binding protein [Spirochaetaceae bacterium]